jgi:hypothetical protein
MMSTPQSRLRIRNQTGSQALVRIRCAGFLIWKTWIAAGSSIAVPGAGGQTIIASCTLQDAHTGVTYTAPSHLPGKCTRLVASRTFEDGAGRFQVDQEPFDQAGHIGLLNLTSTDLHFSLHFPDSPFTLNTVVEAQAEHVISLIDRDVCVTVDGITLAAIPIKTWSGELVIGSADQGGQKIVQMKMSAHGPHGL